MPRPPLILPLLTLICLIGQGCSPETHNLGPAPQPLPAPPRNLPPPTPERTIARLTANIDPDVETHRVASETAFPEAIPTLEDGAKAPGVSTSSDNPDSPPSWALTIDAQTASASMKDWTGLVLVPIITTPSKAYSMKISFDHVEAHPLKDGRIRVWTRIKNESDEDQVIEVGCSFRTVEVPIPDSASFYPIVIPRSASEDVFFVSPAEKNINAYTLLAREARAKNR